MTIRLGDGSRVRERGLEKEVSRGGAERERDVCVCVCVCVCVREREREREREGEDDREM